jgi:hypothetical protein
VCGERERKRERERERERRHRFLERKIIQLCSADAKFVLVAGLPDSLIVQMYVTVVG